MQGTFGKNKPPEYLVYNPSKKTTGKAPHNSIYYSDSGRYSIIGKWDQDGSDNYVYNIQTNQFIPREGKNSEPLYSIFDVYGFLPGEEIIWVSVRSPSFRLYTAKNGKEIYSKAKTAFLGWNNTADKGVIYQGHNKIEIVDLGTGQTLYEVDLPK